MKSIWNLINMTKLRGFVLRNVCTSSSEKNISSNLRSDVYFVTGADHNLFENSKFLIGSWLKTNSDIPLIYCNFGLNETQRKKLSHISGMQVIDLPEAGSRTGWECKANLYQYLDKAQIRSKIIVWVDADAIILQRIPEIKKLIQGYDILVDVHIQSIGEIMCDENISILNLNPLDSYFSSGFWILNKPSFLKTWAMLTEKVKFCGNLWENDAFVASIYHEYMKIRPINGNIWHCRGMTSLQSCNVKNGVVYYEKFPIIILHTNAFYNTSSDGRRTFENPDLAAIQNYYEKQFLNI